MFHVEQMNNRTDSASRDVHDGPRLGHDACLTLGSVLPIINRSRRAA
jgi:hypothetical protein